MRRVLCVVLCLLAPLSGPHAQSALSNGGDVLAVPTACGAISSIFAAGCASQVYTPMEQANASQYLSPSRGAGTPTCLATTLAQFKNCVSGILAAGTIVEVTKQTWDRPGTIDINGHGTAAAPVTIRARHMGGVKITGAALFQIQGSYVRFEGFSFSGSYSTSYKGSAIDIGYSETNQCRHCLAASNSFTDYDHADGSSFSPLVSWGRWNRWADNKVDGKTSIGTILAVDNLHSDAPDHTLIDHNYFANRPAGSGRSSGYETIVIGNIWESGQSPPYDSFRLSSCVIRDNLFYKVNHTTLALDMKSGGCMIRSNTFVQTGNAAIGMRLADDNIVEANIFDGGDVNMTGGVLLRGDGHVVIHNVFQNMSPNRSDGVQVWAAPVSVYAGDPAWRQNGGLYKPSTNATIAFNTFAASNPLTLSEWIVGSPAYNTGSGSVTEPTDVKFVKNVIGNSGNINVLSKSITSTVATSGNLCSAVITDTVCSGAATVVLGGGGFYQPGNANDPATVPTRSAYASLGLPLRTVQRLYHVLRYPGVAIPYKYLTAGDVGPQAW